jgi:hypothetical protein
VTSQSSAPRLACLADRLAFAVVHGNRQRPSSNRFLQFSQKVSRVTDRRRAFPYAFRPQCREEH